MTVYVDDMKARYRGMLMSHMIADTDAELRALAGKLGLAQHHQGDHYDICQSKKLLAMNLGAVPIKKRTAARMMAKKRAGQPMGSPAEAQAEIAARWTAQGREMPAGYC